MIGTMMSDLQDAQRYFAALVPRLIDHALALGYGVRGAEWMRSPEEALRLSRTYVNGKPLGIRNSLHCDRLALDLVLDVRDVGAGAWRAARAAEYEPLAHWWTRSFPNIAAGYDWGDPPHFSYPMGTRR